MKPPHDPHSLLADSKETKRDGMPDEEFKKVGGRVAHQHLAPPRGES